MSWGSFADGFISTKWKEAQGQYNRWKGKDSRNREKWLSGVISAIHQVVRDQWDHRNSVEHDPHSLSHQQIAQELDQAIEEELQTGRGNLTHQQWDQFTSSSNSLLTKSLRYRQNWLLNIEAARQQTMDPTLQGYAPERKALRKWISTGRIH